MIRSLFFIISIALATSALAQEDGRREADSLMRALKKNIPAAGRIEILLRLAAFHIFKPGELKADFDSAGACLEEADRLNKTVQSAGLAGHQLLIRAFMLREKGQETEGRKAVEQAIPLLERSSNKYQLGKAYFELSGYYDWLDTAERSQRLLLTHKAADAFQQAGKMEDQAHALRMLGDLYGANREYAKAIDMLNRAIAVYDSIGHKRLQGVHELLSRFYIKVGDYKRGIQYGLQALRTAQAFQDSSMQLVTINNTLGTLYRQAGRRELALKYYKDALATAVPLNDISAAVLLVYNTSMCYFDIDQPRQALDLIASIPPKLLDDPHPIGRAWMAMVHMRAYQLLQQHAVAYKYSVILEKMLEEPLQDDVKKFVYETLAKYYFNSKNYVKARIYLTKSFSLKQPPISQGAADRSRLLYKIDSAELHYRSAFFNLLTHKTISDSLFNEVRSRQFAQLEVEYETSKKADSLRMKDQHITFLTQKTELQNANLRQADLIKNITIIGIGLALVIMGLLYRQYRLKQQNNKMISQNNEHLQRLVNEKEWLLKEVHHRVKNNLQTVVSLLELQSDDSTDGATAFLESKNRIWAMSLIHQKLYQSEDIASVNMENYLTEMALYLEEMYSKNHVHIVVRSTPIKLDVSQAIPIGLIVNEAITNSMKYAFNDSNMEPVITVELYHYDNKQMELLISDNGAGLPAGFNTTQVKGFGFGLMQGLTEDIEGKFNVITGNGTTIIIQFNPHVPFMKVNGPPVGQQGVV